MRSDAGPAEAGHYVRMTLTGPAEEPVKKTTVNAEAAETAEKILWNSPRSLRAQRSKRRHLFTDSKDGPYGRVAGLHVRMAIAFALAASVLAAACRGGAESDVTQTIVAFEQGALDRWGRGDPDGYFDIMASDVTYFDPTTEKRVDGIDALKALIAPFRGKIKIDRAEILNPRVQRQGDMAVLAFNLISHGAQVDGGKKGDVRWNSTEIYRRFNGKWQIVHSHWSYTKPELREKPAE
jgi:ketosteroid isomerase-like protein